jgi:multimeric flavodoxin WrbA
MPTAVGIAGSPRRKGNSTALLHAVLDGVAAAGATTEVIHLNDLSFRGCQGCDRCAPAGCCTVDDALTPVLRALSLGDIWVLASPVYFDGVSGQMKTFFDRLHWLTIEEGKLKPRLRGSRCAAVILTYEDRPRDDYRKLAETLGSYLGWMGDFSAVRVMSEGDLGPSDAASKRADLLASAEELGRTMVEELKRVLAGADVPHGGKHDGRRVVEDVEEPEAE